MDKLRGIRFGRTEGNYVTISAPPELVPISELLFQLDGMPSHLILDPIIDHVRHPTAEPWGIGGANEYWITVDKDKVVIDCEFTDSSVTLTRQEFLPIIEAFAHEAELAKAERKARPGVET